MPTHLSWMGGAQLSLAMCFRVDITQWSSCILAQLIHFTGQHMCRLLFCPLIMQKKRQYTSWDSQGCISVRWAFPGLEGLILHENAPDTWDQAPQAQRTPVQSVWKVGAALGCPHSHTIKPIDVCPETAAKMVITCHYGHTVVWKRAQMSICFHFASPEKWLWCHKGKVCFHP